MRARQWINISSSRFFVVLCPKFLWRIYLCNWNEVIRLTTYVIHDNVRKDQYAKVTQKILFLISRSPVKGVFKIPELPKKFNNMEVFSQYVEEDNYEMVCLCPYLSKCLVIFYTNDKTSTHITLQDSFCVDSHIGLTQVNDISELELAEIVLEEERKRKKKAKSQSTTQQDNDDSPVVRRKNKNARQIQSDSDDSS